MAEAPAGSGTPPPDGAAHGAADGTHTVEVPASAAAARKTPAWQRVTDGETRVQVGVAIAVLIFLQTRVPQHLSLAGSWVLPTVEVIMIAGLVVLDPGRISRTEKFVRALSLGFVAVASLANGWAAAALVVGLVRGTEGRSAPSLLIVGGNIWVTNVLIFAIWYWELDRGGPAARAAALRKTPDFVFPQMTSPELAEPEWEPEFGDYLYLALTNATAFSPTDVLPYTRWSKMTMAVQALTSLSVGALIIARAVNILQ
jgi:uncharacterized membrane protein